MCHECFPTDSIEAPVSAALVAVNGRVTFGGADVGAVASAAPGEPVRGPVVFLVGGAGGVVAKARVGRLDELRSVAREMAARERVPVALAVTVKSGEADGNTVSVLAARYLYEPHNREALIDAAHKAVPEAFHQLGRLAPMAKELDPLDPRYFDRVAASLSAYMERNFKQISGPVLDKWIHKLIDANWADATDAELMLITKQFNRAFREIGGKHWLGIRGQLYHRTQGLGQAVKGATVKRYDLAINPNLALKDLEAIRQITASHAHYVTDAMGNIATQASQQARMVVRNGLSKGLGSKEIGGDLWRALGDTLKGRTRHYFDVAALAILNRSQSYSKVVTFSEAGVQKVLWDSVLDEVTTRTCRFADGKVFSVKAILGAYAKTSALSDARDIRYTQPWMRERRIKTGEFKGKMGLFLRDKAGKDTMVAAELVSGFGQVDKRGTWHPAMDIETLQDMGFSAPPGHGS